MKIHECNELAYFFAQYLEQQEIPVTVEGVLWEGIFEGMGEEMPDYRTLHIYAEGIAPKSNNWIENMLRSASVEFECIDQIYEKNIKEGTITNADGGEKEFLEKLRKCLDIVIMGTDADALDVYDYLLENGIDIWCFVSDVAAEQNHSMFGKQILSRYDVITSGRDVAWVNVRDKGSAWGHGGADAFDYFGYRRNERFFQVKDYLKIPCRGIINILRNGDKIACIGERFLSEKLIEFLKVSPVLESVECRYWDLLSERASTGNVSVRTDKDSYILLVMPSVRGSDDDEQIQKKCNELIARLKEFGICHYSCYFSDVHTFLNMAVMGEGKKNCCLLPKGVVLGVIDDHSGNALFRGILDGHPSLLLMDFGYLDSYLFWFCICLAGRKAEEIVPLFFEFYKTEMKKDLFDEQAFRMKMHQLLSECMEPVTSQELFVMFHIAYQFMYDRSEIDIREYVIYWEPHYVPREVIAETANWLYESGIFCHIVDMVRGSCKRLGSRLKMYLSERTNQEYPPLNYWKFTYSCSLIDKESYEGCERTVVRFEDLKLRPEEILHSLCEKWNIPWSATLMETTCHGKEMVYNNMERKISGFDLQPVYNTYEKYFSELDRMRIMITSSSFQRKYGYPYVLPSEFSRRELQELFLKEHRFEKEFQFFGVENEIKYRLKKIYSIHATLQKVRMHHLELEVEEKE